MGGKGKSQMPNQQKLKICKLNADGEIEKIDALSVKPVVVCAKCRAESNDPLRVCTPRTLKAR